MYIRYPSTGGGSGSGDVSGPGSSTNNALAIWSGTSGTNLANSAVTLVGGAFTHASLMSFNAPGLEFYSTNNGPDAGYMYFQVDDSTGVPGSIDFVSNSNSANGGSAGGMTFTAGTASGTTSTGGSIQMTAGTGTSTNGSIVMVAGGATSLEARDTGPWVPNNKDLRFNENAGADYVAIKAASTVTASYTIALPGTAPTAGQVLTYTGPGYDWSTPAAGSITIQTDTGTSPVGSTFTFTSSDSTISIDGDSGTDTVDFTLPTSARTQGITCIFDGGGSAITAGKTVYVRIPYACTITGWQLGADVSGSIVIDVWKDTYANFPPVVGDSIAGTEKPTLSSAQKNEDLTLSTWTTSVTAGDWIAFNVDSAATVTFVSLQLLVTRT
jgi:hypothetical protein